MLSGIVRCPGFKKRIAIPKIVMALIDSISILLSYCKQFLDLRVEKLSDL